MCTQSPQVATSKIDEYARGMISGSGSTLFEELGLYYIGPVDGHNIDDLIAGRLLCITFEQASIGLANEQVSSSSSSSSSSGNVL